MNRVLDFATLLHLGSDEFGILDDEKNNKKIVTMDNKILLDNGGRRSGIDRRKFSYSVHVPERRSSIDRRRGLDRRKQLREQLKYLKIEKEEAF